MKTKQTKLRKAPLAIPSRVFSVMFYMPGIEHRINAMGYNIAMMETKIELSRLVENAFDKRNHKINS